MSPSRSRRSGEAAQGRRSSSWARRAGAFAWLAILLAGPAARAVVATSTQPLPGEVPVDLRADELTYDSKRGVLVLTGHVVVDRANARLRAGRARLDRNTNVLTLEGGVIAAQENQLVTAEGAIVYLNARSADLGKAVLFLKETGSDLRAIDDRGKAAGTGRNALTARAAAVEQLPGGGLSLREVLATPCNCAAEPDYEVEARTARVRDDRAALEGTHLLLLGGRLPLFPLSLPLLDRQSGLLAPQIGLTQAAGFRFSQPIYWAIDRSWDATITPGFFSGNPSSEGNATIATRSIQGPRLGLELRGAPADWLTSEVGIELFYDLAAGDSLAVAKADGERVTRPGRGWGGLRGTLRAAQRAELLGWSFGLQGLVVSDAMILSDAQPAGLDAFLDVLRTDLGAWRSAGAESFGLSATGLQDVRVVYNAPDRRLFGPEARATPQRLPSPFLQLLPRALGPFAPGLEASAVWIGKLSQSALEQSTGFGPTDLGTAATSSADLSRPTLVRIDLAPRLTLGLPDGSPVRGRLLLGGRADAWLHPKAPARDARRLQAFADAEASVLVAGALGGLTHSIEPKVQLRAISPAWLAGPNAPPGDPADGGGPAWSAAVGEAEQGSAPGLTRDAGATGRLTTLGVPAWRRPYDELDGAAPSTGAVEATVGIRQTLWRRNGTSQAPVRAAWLLLQQDLLLWDGGGAARTADAVASFGLSFPNVTFGADVRWDWLSESLSLATGGAKVMDSRGDAISFGWTALRGGAADRVHAGIDELFAAARFAAVPGDLTATLGGGAVWILPTRIKGLQLGYDLNATVGSVPIDWPNLVHSATLAWKPPCGCAAMSLGVDFRFNDTTLLGLPGVRFLFDFRSLGR